MSLGESEWFGIIDLPSVGDCTESLAELFLNLGRRKSNNEQFEPKSIDLIYIGKVSALSYVECGTSITF